MVEKVMWFLKDRFFEGVIICDVGCGIGSFLILFVFEGVEVYVSDILLVMVDEVVKWVEVVLKFNVNDKLI